MRLPHPNKSALARYLFGRYVARCLDRARQVDLLEIADRVNQALLAASRHREDMTVPVEEARADRDIADADLDEAARTTRVRLAGRSARAVKEPPYTAIFPNGIAEYVRAKVADQVSRYGRLIERLELHLAPDDPTRVEMVALLKGGLQAWAEGVASVDRAQNALEHARWGLKEATMAWEAGMIEIYGLLLGRVGKEKAERFFPKPERSEPKAKGAAEVGPAVEGEEPHPAK